MRGVFAFVHGCCAFPTSVHGIHHTHPGTYTFTHFITPSSYHIISYIISFHVYNREIEELRVRNTALAQDLARTTTPTPTPTSSTNPTVSSPSTTATLAAVQARVEDLSSQLSTVTVQRDELQGVWVMCGCMVMCGCVQYAWLKWLYWEVVIGGYMLHMCSIYI